jgi:predicted dehydrogenase
MSQRVLRTILVGVSRRGEWPLERARPETGFAPVGLVDPAPEALAAARARTGLPPEACFTSLAEALRAVRAEVVIACSPTVTHVPVARAGFAAGLAVLVEKGMAPDWDSARAVVAEAARMGAKFCVAQNYRYRAMERTVARALRDETAPYAPGRVFWIDYVQHRVRPEPRTLNYPFASVWDMSCHHFDNLLAWLGPVETVTAQSPAAPWSAYAHAANTMALLRFANGTVVHYAHTHDAARAEVRLRLHGERGALFGDEGSLEFSPRPAVNFGEAPVAPVELEPGPNEAGVLADFHRYVAEGVEPGISGRHNLETMALCELTVRSIREGRTVARSELEG